MNPEKLTLKAQEAVNEASVIAQKADHAQVEAEHLLLALLQQEGGIAVPIIERIGADTGIYLPPRVEDFGFSVCFGGHSDSNLTYNPHPALP